MKWKIWFVCLVLWLLLVCVVNPARCQTVDKKFILVNSLLVASTIYDVETTFRAIRNCPTCSEVNPIMRPFVNRGRATTYLFEGALNGGAIYLSYTLKKKGVKLWWLVPSGVSLSHGVAGTFNLRF